MDSKEKTAFTKLGKIEKFSDIMESLTIYKTISENDKSFITQFAVMTLKIYEKDKRLRGHRELAYFIILRLALIDGDYNLLYDFSVNYGFYPLADLIKKHKFYKKESIQDEIIHSILDTVFTDDKIILTSEQKTTVDSLLEDIQSDKKNILFSAPTSYGKSTFIIKAIQHNKYKRIAIIVPTKSLLAQTHKMIREQSLDYKILLHDEMYNKEDKFIAIFTQERALRFSDRHKIFFDLLFIDEAHNLFDKDPRSILLSRVIRLNSQKNKDLKTIYLSPLIQDVNNIKFCNQEIDISERKILYSMKEPYYLEYKQDGAVYSYNRFVNKYFKLDTKKLDYLDYIIENSSEKTFIYLYRPVKIEEFSKELYGRLDDIDSKKIDTIIDILNDQVHEDFYINKYIKKGVVYLHGKMPDEIKEYLEYKFSDIELNIKYIVANSVIMEGINLPIDSMFIMSGSGAGSSSKLTNLVGRVNRLKNIFESSDIHKLSPKIHFINTDHYNRKNGNLANQIMCLRSNIFNDKIGNPIMKSGKKKLDEEEIKTREDEEIVLQGIDSLKSRLLYYKIDDFYGDLDDKLDKIASNIKKYQNNEQNIDPIDLIYYVFIDGVISIDNFFDKTNDYELIRFQYESTRNYYKNFMLVSRTFSLKEFVKQQVKYFKHRIERGDPEFYFGTSYGEIPKSTSSYKDSGFKPYINLSAKSDEILVNLSIVKLKIEQDFITHKLNKCFSFMYEYKIIDEDSYNDLAYGTHDKESIQLIKSGLPLRLSTLLKSENQLQNVEFDKYNNIIGNSDLRTFIDSRSDFEKYHLEKTISFKKE